MLLLVLFLILFKYTLKTPSNSIRYTKKAPNPYRRGFFR